MFLGNDKNEAKKTKPTDRLPPSKTENASMDSLLDSKPDATTTAAATRNFPRLLQPNGQHIQRPNRLHSYQLPPTPGDGKVCATAETGK